MSWRTEISLKNNKPEDVVCVIPKGQIFENKKVGTSIQNVAAAREYRLVIPGDSRMTVEIQVLCINKSFSPPQGQPGKVSIFKVSDSFTGQQDLWGNLAQIP